MEATSQQDQPTGVGRSTQQIPRGIAAQIKSPQQRRDQGQPATRREEAPQEDQVLPQPQQPSTGSDFAAREEEIQPSLEQGEINSDQGRSEPNQDQEGEGGVESEWEPAGEDQEPLPGPGYQPPNMAQSTSNHAVSQDPVGENRMKSAPKFDGTDWWTWKFRFEMWANSEGVFGFFSWKNPKT